MNIKCFHLLDGLSVHRRRKSWWKLYRFKITNWKPAVLKKEIFNNIHNILSKHTSLHIHNTLCFKVYSEGRVYVPAYLKTHVQGVVGGRVQFPSVEGSDLFHHGSGTVLTSLRYTTAAISTLPSILLCWSISWYFVTALKVYPSWRINS